MCLQMVCCDQDCVDGGNCDHCLSTIDATTSFGEIVAACGGDEAHMCCTGARRQHLGSESTFITGGGTSYCGGCASDGLLHDSCQGRGDGGVKFCDM